MLFVDIDDFKIINDTVGHSTGDLVLAEVAKRLQRCLRTGDTAARLGGDEFAVLLEDDPTADDAVGVAERTLAEFRNPVHVAGDRLSIQLSIGVAKGRPGRNTAEELLRDADVAMYGAKARGKNQMQLFEPGMQRAMEQRHRLRGELEVAIERREFTVHYQPIIDLDSGSTVAVEALVRWNHPTRGSVSPARLHPLRRGERADRADRRDRARGRLPPGRPARRPRDRRPADQHARERLHDRAARPGLPRRAWTSS